MEEANQLLRDAALTNKVVLEIEFDVAGMDIFPCLILIFFLIMLLCFQYSLQQHRTGDDQIIFSDPEIRHDT